MAADDEDNEVDGDGRRATARRATARQAIMATTTTMAMGDNDNDDGDGATGNEVNDDGEENGCIMVAVQLIYRPKK